MHVIHRQTLLAAQHAVAVLVETSYHCLAPHIAVAATYPVVPQPRLAPGDCVLLFAECLHLLFEPEEFGFELLDFSFCGDPGLSIGGPNRRRTTVLCQRRCG
jgi:hypothetical protein